MGYQYISGRYTLFIQHAIAISDILSQTKKSIIFRVIFIKEEKIIKEK